MSAISIVQLICCYMKRIVEINLKKINAKVQICVKGGGGGLHLSHQ